MRTDLLARVIGRWKADGVFAAPGAPTAPQPHWPADVAAFYAQVGGMADGAMDRELFRFWRRGELEVVVAADAGQRWTGTLFCDWSIWALGYAFGPAADPRVAIVDGVACRFVAATFTEFVELYLTDDRRQYG